MSSPIVESTSVLATLQHTPRSLFESGDQNLLGRFAFLLIIKTDSGSILWAELHPQIVEVCDISLLDAVRTTSFILHIANVYPF